MGMVSKGHAEGVLSVHGFYQLSGLHSLLALSFSGLELQIFRASGLQGSPLL